MKALSIIFISVLSLSYTSAQQNVDWFNLLGKTIEDRDVMSVISEYGEYTSQFFRKDYETQLNWAENGVAITMNDLSVIKKIYFFNDQYSITEATFNRFRGTLPLGINLNMSPAQMKKVLGKPTSEEGSIYKKLTYITNFHYEILFKKDVVQYVRIGLLTEEQPKKTN